MRLDQDDQGPSKDALMDFMMVGLDRLMGQLERTAIKNVREEKEANNANGNGTPRWFYKLDIEVWRHIVSFLVPPRVKPLSGRTKQEYAYEERSTHKIQLDDFATLPDVSDPGCTSRSAIRAGDLAILMRTSVAFNQITADHLYRHIICDSLPLLLKGVSGLRQVTHMSIERKDTLLARTRSIQLEYLSKGDGRHTNYLTLMRKPLSWALVGGIYDADNSIHQAASEALAISERLEEVLRAVRGVDPEPYFPKLTHLSVGSIFGAHEFCWDSVAHPQTGLVFQNATGRKEDERPPIGKLIENCQASTMKLFQSSPLAYYCTRSTFGPYAPPIGFVWGVPIPKTSSSTPTPTPSPARSIPTFTFHANIQMEFVRAAMGSRTRWVLENEDRYLYPTNSLVRNFIKLLEDHHRQVREVGLIPNFDIDVFISGNRYVPIGTRYRSAEDKDSHAIPFPTPKIEKSLVPEIWQAEYKQMRSGGLPKLQGISSWRSSAESGGCQACGWEFEVLGEKEAVPHSGVKTDGIKNMPGKGMDKGRGKFQKGK